MTRPTLYLSNWSSHRTPGMHGPGRKFSIMAKPRAWERGDGKVEEFIPPVFALAQAKAGAWSPERYMGVLADAWSHPPIGWYSPGVLTWVDGNDGGPVLDGDTLLCACAKGAVCHRRAAAPFLVRAGWRVILDGVEVAP